MLRRALLGTFLVGLLTLTTSWTTPRAAGSGRELRPHVAGEVLIKFKPGVSRLTRERLLLDIGSRDGAREAARVGRSRTRRVRLAGMDVATALERYADHPDVEYVEPNYLISIAATPNDQNFIAQWHHNNTGQSGGTPDADIDSPAAWDVTTGAPNVLVAIIDSGVDIAHPDLAANIFVNDGEIANNDIDDDNNGYIDDVSGWDFGDGDSDPTDGNGHGTHVAGIVGAVGNNGIGVAGMVWNASLLPCKFLDSSGVGTITGATGCLDYAIQMDADIINASWVGGNSATLRDAVERTYEAGILFVASAGNSPGGNNNDLFPVYPAAYEFPNILTVAATNHDDQLWSSSHFGPNTVDIAAPGEDILSTWPTGYAFLSGTSMAAPLVAGVAALIKERVPDIDVEALRQVILDRSDRLPNLVPVISSGGRLNAFQPVADQDQTAPSRILDLATVEPDATRIDLIWTATGDDADEGRAARYEIRYSGTPIDDDNFGAAEAVSAPPPPSPAGTPERMRVTGLTPDTTYHFAIKAFDEFNNASPASNDATGTTAGPPRVSIAPERIDLQLVTGQDAVRTVTVRNDGQGEYTFEVNAERPDPGDGSAASQGFGVELAPTPRSMPRFPTAWAPSVDGSGAPDPDRVTLSGEEDAAGLRLLILESAADVSRIREALIEFSDIAVVDVHEGRFDPPSLSLLQSYDSVLVVVNNTFEDPLTVGNALADYADGGGGIVLTLASFIQGFEPLGRFLDQGYSPFAQGTGPVPGSVLGDFNANHPIMAGVETLSGSLLGVLTVAPQANLVADWANGQPCVATNHGNIVGVNVFAGGDGFWDGDLPTLLHNAAIWSTNRVPWIAVEPGTAVVPAGGAIELEVRFDAVGLVDGNYAADLVFRGDDPDNPLLLVETQLDVMGAPDLAVTPDGLDFGETFVGQPVDRVLSIRNIGSELLTVSGIASDLDAFVVETSGFSLGPGARRDVPVRFAPETAGAAAATLTISSNDPDQPERTVSAQGVGALPPDVTLGADRLTATLNAGEIEAQTLTIANDGGSDLVFELRLVDAGAAAFVATQTPTPQGGHPGTTHRPAPRPAPGHVPLGLDPTRPAPAWTDAAPQDRGATVQLAGEPFDLREDFEDGSLERWTQSNSSNFKDVTDETAANGTSYSYRQTNQQAGHFNGIFRELPSITPEYLGFWIRSGSTQQNDAYVLVTGAARFEAIFFFADSTGRFYINADVGGNTDYEYEAETWYFVEFRDIDFADRSFDYYVDTELIQEDVPFRNPADVLNFHALHLYNFDNGSQAWWDQIVLSDEPPAQPVRLSPKRGVIAPGETVDVEVRFDSRGLLAGDHFTDIHVESNDPDDPLEIVSTQLTVIGSPAIDFPDGVPAFDEAFVGTTATVTMRVANQGTDTLDVSAASFDDDAFQVTPDAFTVPPRESTTLTLSFTAAALGPRAATLTLISNDPGGPLALPFSAVAVEPPLLVLDPGEVDATLVTGQLETHVITVANDGGSDLEFEIAIESDETSPPRVPLVSPLPPRPTGVGDPVGDAADVRGPLPEFRPRTDATHLPDDTPWPPVAAGDVEPLLLYDGFESGNYDGWGDQGGAGLKTVTDQSAADGTRFSYRESDAPGGHLTGIYRTLGGIQPGYVSFWIRSPDRFTADSYVVLRDPDGQNAVFFFANDEGRLYVNADVGGNALVAYSAATWIHVELKDVDFQRQFFDYWIDGELVQSNVPFRNAGSIESFYQLDIYSFEEGATGNWDEFLIADREPVERIAVTPRDGFVPPGESVELRLQLDASRADSSVNRYVVRVLSNDPVNPDTELPVTLRVEGAPDIDLPAETVDFGLRFTGTTTTVPVAVANEGPRLLSIASAATDDPAFTVQPTSLQIEADSVVSLDVRFHPTEPGTHTGTLRLLSDDPDEPVTSIALTGFAQDPPDVDIAPAAFRETLVSHEMRSHTLRLANAGSSPLSWSIFFDGLQPGWLLVAPRGGSLPAGTQTEITLAFNAGPLLPGSYVTTMFLQSNDPDEPELTIPVEMIVVAAPVISVSPDPLEFEDAFVGDSSTALLQISNLGDAPLEISDLAIDNPLFSTETTSLTVAPNTAEAVELRFAPTALDPVSGTLTLTCNDPFRPTVTVALTGAGETPPDIEVSPLSFSEAMSSFEVLIRQLAITNRAGSELTYEIEVVGRGPVGVEASGETPSDRGADGIDAPRADDEIPPEWLAPMATLGPRGGLEAGPASAPRPRIASVPVAKGGGGSSVLLREDFEDGEFADTWNFRPSTSVRTISETVAADYSTRSFRVTDADEGHLTGIYRELPQLQPGYLGFWVRSTSELTNDGYVVIRDRNGAEAVFFFLSEVGRIYCNADVGGSFSARYREDAWVFVELKNIDFERQTFDFFVNYQRFARSVAFRNFGTIEEFSSIDLYNWTDNAEAYWDEIVFATEAPFDGLRVRPFRGALESGIGTSVNAIFDTRNLIDGRYEAEIHVRSNDPDEPEIVIPATIDHTGVVILGVNPESIEFDDVLVGVPRLDRVTILNHGTARLVVSSVVLDHPHFSASTDAFELAPGATRSIEVLYDPPAAETVEATMTLTTNDLDDPVFEIPIRASAVIPARLELDKDAVDETLFSGQTSTRTLEISNPGGLPLEFSVDLRTPQGFPVPEETLIFEDDMESGEGAWSTEVASPPGLWHLTDRQSHGGATAWWCGDDATGDYDTGGRVSTALVTPPIDLRGMEAPIRFSFFENHITEPGYDQCMVDLSLDGGATWIPMRGGYGDAPSGDSRGWKKRFVNLDDYSDLIVQIRFYFETLDGTNNQFPGWFVDDVRVTALGSPFVTATPLGGTVTSGQSQQIVLTFDAFDRRPAGEYVAQMNIDSNDPFLPYTEVPARLTVRSPGRLAVPGEIVTLEAEVSSTGAASHRFPVEIPPAGPGTLNVVAAGDYDADDEFLTATVESFVAGTLGGTGTACAAFEADLGIPSETLRALASDGAIEVTLKDSDAVDSNECASPSRSLRLSYPRQRDGVGFGEVAIGSEAARTLTLTNVGEGELRVLSIGADRDDLTASPQELTIPAQGAVTVQLVWSPTEAGALNGTLVVASDDPFDSRTDLELSGVASGSPPQAEVSPASVEAALPPHGDQAKQRSIRLSNGGDGALTWTASAPAMASVSPDSGTVDPGAFVEIVLTLDAGDLDEGDYAETVTISTNDPDRPTLEVAVTLRVRDVALDRLELDFSPKYAERPGTLEVVLQLPAGHDAAEVDLATVQLNGVAPEATAPVYLDTNRDGIDEMILQFDLQALAPTMPEGTTAEMRLVGEVRDRTWFHGSKYVRGRLIVEAPE